MTLHIGDALGNGISRAATFSGGVLIGLTILYQLVFLGSTNTVARAYIPPEAQQPGQFAFTFPIPPAVASVLSLLGLLFGIVIYLAATRALVRDVEALSTLPSELFTRRIGRALLSAFGASILVGVSVAIGLVLLVVPGIFLAVSFLFVVFAVAVEDDRAIDAMRRSWSLASGNRWRLFALLLIIVVAGSILGSIGSVLTVLDPLVGQLASIVVNSVISIASYGVLADAYLQLREDVEEPGEPGVEPHDDSTSQDHTPA